MNWSGRALSSPDQMSHRITKESTEVWCDFAEQIAATNFDGSEHFCQYCGSTEHRSV